MKQEHVWYSPEVNEFFLLDSPPIATETPNPHTLSYYDSETGEEVMSYEALTYYYVGEL